jgi:very-short-patch-repair endonuclease
MATLKGWLTLAARDLRQRSTPAEKKLWSVLRRKSLKGLKFYRQHPMHGFILDFYCPSKNLVIELDGEIHDDPEQKEYDQMRDEYLQSKDFIILRFKNDEVLCNTYEVAKRILQECNL